MIYFRILLLISCWSVLSCSTSSTDAPPSITFPDTVKDYFVNDPNWEIFRSADSLKWSRQYRAAATTFKTILDTSSSLNDNALNYGWNQLAYCHLLVDEEAQAVQYLRRLENRLEQLSEEARADYFFNRGNYLIAVESGEEAIPYLVRADSLYAEIYEEDHLRKLQSLTNSGKAYLYYLGQFKDAEIRIDKALSLLDRYKNLQPYAASTYLAKANIVRDSRIYFEGLCYANLALVTARESPDLDTLFVADCYTVQAHMLKKLERMDSARKQLEKAIQLGESKRVDNERLKNYYEGMILTYLNAKDSTFFYEYLNKIKKRFYNFPNGFQNPKSLEAYFSFKTNQYDKAITKYRSLELDYASRKNANSKLYAEIYYILAESYKKVRSFEKALKYVDELIMLKFSEDYIPRNIPTKDMRLFNKLDANDQQNLLIYYSKNPDIFLSRFESDSTQIEQLYKAVDWYAAIDSMFFQHVDIIDENVLLTFSTEHFHTTYGNALRACYLAYQNSQEQYYLELAHQLLERVKYTLLYRNMLAGASDGIVNVPDSLRATEEVVNKKLALLRQLKFQAPDSIIKENEFETIRLLSQQKELYQSLKYDYKDYFYKRMRQQVVPLADFQNRLGEAEEVAVQYHLGEDYLSTLVITPDTLGFLQSPIPDSLEKWLEIYQYLLYKPDLAYRTSTPRKYRSVAYPLYQFFVEPIETFLENYSKVVVCADASIALFPFNALLKEWVDPIDLNYKKLPYLVKDYEFRNVFSMKNYWYKSQNRSVRKKAPKVLAYAYSKEQSSNLIAGLFRSNTLDELAGSYLEVDAIKDLYGTRGNHFRYKLESTKTDFLEQVHQGEYDIIHLALHAASNDQDRYDNRIYFRDEKDEEKNTILYSYEIEQLDIPSSLVVLSACQTATGKVLQAEGTFSLARSFITAGTESVVSSLWEVDDLATAEIMKLFYQGYHKSNEVATSLQSAQVKYLEEVKDTAQAYPGYWAAFVVLE